MAVASYQTKIHGVEAEVYDLLLFLHTAVILYEFLIACVNRAWPLRWRSQLEERVRDMLNSAKDDPNEMFRVCAKFNALFVRPNIQV
jgi:hypothetical protein